MPRLHIALVQKGHTISKSTLYRICRDNGLLQKRPKKSIGTTKADPAAVKSKNLIAGDFTADKPNEKWLGDLTEIPCRNGKLYMSAILDCFDGTIVGLSIEDNMRKEMVAESLKRAFSCHGSSGLIFHSDKGSQ